MECRKCHCEIIASEYQIKKGDYICLKCKRDYNGKWRAKRKAAGLKTGGSKTWNEDKKKIWLKEYYANPANRKRRAADMKRYRNDPSKRFRHIARWAAKRALNNGTITRFPCAICGKHKTQMHHPDYKKPLMIVWLCAKCHRKEHAQAEGGAQ